MEILSAYKKQLKTKSDPSGNVVNLSKKSFSSDAFTILHKNPNFVPTPKKYNKKQLDTEAENFIPPRS